MRIITVLFYSNLSEYVGSSINVNELYL